MAEPSPNRAAMIVLAYLWPLALIPLLVEKDDTEVQWHAKHGIVLMLAEILFLFMFAIVTSLVSLATLGVGCVLSMFVVFVWIAILAVHRTSPEVVRAAVIEVDTPKAQRVKVDRFAETLEHLLTRRPRGVLVRHGVRAPRGAVTRVLVGSMNTFDVRLLSGVIRMNCGSWSHEATTAYAQVRGTPPLMRPL